jgi:predicted esterase
MGAGRYAVDQKPPPMDKIRGKPVFIGIGENDTVHSPRAKNAARIYESWGADVTFEEWPGVGHTFGNSKLLLKWLEHIFSGSEVH